MVKGLETLSDVPLIEELCSLFFFSGLFPRGNGRATGISIRYSELPPLVTVWNEQADRLRASGEFQTFNEKLRREIAIEAGIIERLYTIDRGITRLLIEQGINEALIPHGATDLPVKQVVSLN